MWATGVAPRPFTVNLMQRLGKAQFNKNGLVVDETLKVIFSVWFMMAAVNDCNCCMCSTCQSARVIMSCPVANATGIRSVARPTSMLWATVLLAGTSLCFRTLPLCLQSASRPAFPALFVCAFRRAGAGTTSTTAGNSIRQKHHSFSLKFVAFYFVASL